MKFKRRKRKKKIPKKPLTVLRSALPIFMNLFLLRQRKQMKSLNSQVMLILFMRSSNRKKGRFAIPMSLQKMRRFQKLLNKS